MYLVAATGFNFFVSNFYNFPTVLLCKGGEYLVMLNMFRKDLVFLHPPSVYDFRKDTTMFGPISDVVPSSPTFEMYPVGITSIADTLEHSGFNVQIINLAYQMLRSPKYDVEKVIAQLTDGMFHIYLTRLPHDNCK